MSTFIRLWNGNLVKFDGSSWLMFKVFVPMANSFQMIKHNSKTIQLLKRILFLVLSIAWYVHSFIFILVCRILPTCRLLSIWDIHSQSRNIFRDGHYFTELNHGSKQLCIKESFELHYRIGKCNFFASIPSGVWNQPSGTFHGHIFFTFS